MPLPNRHDCHATYAFTSPRLTSALLAENRYIAFLSGLSRVTVPNSKHEAWVQGSGLVLAADTDKVVTGIGHRSIYPGNTETVGIAMRTVDGKLPNHKKLLDGPCPQNDRKNIDLRGIDLKPFDGNR